MPVLAAPSILSASRALRRTALALVWCAALGLLIAPAGAEDAGTPLLKAPVVPVPPLFTQAAIDKATGALDGIVADDMKRTGMPGVAVGIVYKDKVIYAKGFGARELGKRGAIDPDTVFLLASVSKPIASTIVAKLVGDGVVKWDDPAKLLNPAFALNDPYVTEHATLADLLAHRSGLRAGPATCSRISASTAAIFCPISTSSRSIRSARLITTAISATRPAASPVRWRQARVGKTSPTRCCSSRLETIGENANGFGGAIFTVGDDGKASKVVLDDYDRTGLGTFVRE
jgi:hypothetical protein